MKGKFGERPQNSKTINKTRIDPKFVEQKYDPLSIFFL